MKINSIIVTLCFCAAIVTACSQNNSMHESEKKPMQVKVVSLEKCNATPPTIKLAKDIAKELGIAIDFKHVIVKTAEEANEQRHIGSPTVQINGIDIEPQARGIDQFGIT